MDLHASVTYSSAAINCTNPQTLLLDLALSMSSLGSKPGSLLCHVKPEAVVQGSPPWHLKSKLVLPYGLHFTGELVYICRHPAIADTQWSLIKIFPFLSLTAGVNCSDMKKRHAWFYSWKDMGAYLIWEIFYFSVAKLGKTWFQSNLDRN